MSDTNAAPEPTNASSPPVKLTPAQAKMLDQVRAGEIGSRNSRRGVPMWTVRGFRALPSELRVLDALQERGLIRQRLVNGGRIAVVQPPFAPRATPEPTPEPTAAWDGSVPNDDYGAGDVREARDLDALEARARAHSSAIDVMHEIGRGVGALPAEHFTAFRAWQNDTDRDHADTVLELIERLRAAEARPHGMVTDAEPPHTDEYGDCAHPDTVAIGHGEAECPDCMTVGPVAPPADDVREACQQPPVGWHCSREAGHDGPCAARPIGQHDHKWEVHQGWAKCTLCGLEDEDPKWEPSSPPADDVREALRDIVRGGSYSRFPDDLPYADVVDRILAVFEVRPYGTVTDAAANEAPQELLNEFYVSGLRKAIAIIQGEEYPLSNGLARVSSMVSDIEDEIAAEEDVQLREADVVVRWLTRFAERGIVTIGGKGGALEAAREVES